MTSSPGAVSTTVNAVGGLATFNGLVFGTPGTYTLNATAPGLAPASSRTFTIGQSSTLTLSASPNPARYGQSVTLTAAVSPAAATGTVTFYDGTTVLGASPLAGGQAQFGRAVLLASGLRTLKARYTGDSNYAASASAPLTESINAVTGSGFQPTVNYGGGSGPYAVAASDVNGDGIADLVVADFVGNNVSVLLGNANGTFQTAAPYATGNDPAAVVVADFNGDGKPDIATANFLDGTVSVLLGKGGRSLINRR